MPSRSLQDLHPDTAARAQLMVDDASFDGIDLLVYCTYRSFEEQARLYRNGRSVKVITSKAAELRDKFKRPDLAAILFDVGPQYGRKVLTHAAPGQSYHNYRFAFDVVPLRQGRPVWGTTEANDKELWLAVGRLAKRHGLEWGGDWTRFKDYPHIQSPGLNWPSLIRDGAPT